MLCLQHTVSVAHTRTEVILLWWLLPQISNQLVAGVGVEWVGALKTSTEYLICVFCVLYPCCMPLMVCTMYSLSRR